eukprot:TRINITY_DN104969_c0_g1_i1.p1 TRINITY_DN104969_c0_g1~~TRINITY_DN104969_c0_g1_i1.p1  ORF type:complete len:273 (-),score=36.28 TRINITY_DN104969_c0_g1_i1:244-1062(-)
MGRATEHDQALRADLHKRLSSTVRTRTGPSFDERVEAASKAFTKKARAVEAEQNKVLQTAVENGRSRPTSAPFRPRSLGPNQQAMLQERLKQMREQELEYKHYVAAIKQKMDQREPLFRLSDVQAGIEMLQVQREEKKRELQLEEAERWETIRSVKENAFGRPLLIEDYNYRPPPKERSEAASAPGQRPQSAGSLGRSGFGACADNEFDERIANEISKRWFAESDWGKKVKEMKERADSRQKLHEMSYPQKVDGHKFSKTRLMHSLVATTFH